MTVKDFQSGDHVFHVVTGTGGTVVKVGRKLLHVQFVSRSGKSVVKQWYPVDTRKVV